MCTWLERTFSGVGLVAALAALALVIWIVVQVRRTRSARRTASRGGEELQWTPPLWLKVLLPALTAIAGLFLFPLREWAACEQCDEVSIGIDDATIVDVEIGRPDDVAMVTIEVVGSSENVDECPGLAVVALSRAAGSNDDWRASERLPTDDRGRWVASLTFDMEAIRTADRLDVQAVATEADPPADRSVGDPAALDPAGQSGVVSVTLPPRLTVLAPMDGDAVAASHGGVGAALVAVSGSSRSVALDPDLRVVVLVRPVDPFAAGWWTSPPVAVDADGAWRTEIFLGSAEAPAEAGHRFEVLAVATSTDPRNFAQPLSDLGLLADAARSQAVEFTLGPIEGRPSVTIDLDENEHVVASPFDTSVATLSVPGTTANLGDDDRVTVLVRAIAPPAVGWWPAQAVATDSDGRWQATVFVGSTDAPVADGHVFELVAVVGAVDPDDVEAPLSSPDQLGPVARSTATRAVVSVPEPASLLTVDPPVTPVIAEATCDDVAIDVTGVAERVDVDASQVAVLARWSHQEDAPWQAGLAVDISEDGTWQATALLPLPTSTTSPTSLTAVAALSSRATPPRSVAELGQLDAEALSEPFTIPISDITIPAAARPLAFEGEHADSDQLRTTRSEASGDATLSMGDGDGATFQFVTCDPTALSLRIRYSNDNYDDRSSERIEVFVDGVRVADFVAADTGGYGAGWNQFVSSPPSSGVELSAGRHRIDVTVAGGDGLGIELDLVAEAPPKLRVDDDGPWVEALQRRLSELGFGVEADGTFGPDTEAAVRAAQAEFAVDVDGICGPDTWMALAVDR